MRIISCRPNRVKTMTITTPTPNAMTVLVLPGPSRKRLPSPYFYRVAYRNPNPTEPGCSMVWSVFGGREPYQITLERTAAGEERWHCSCADAVYRGELDPNHRCKHIYGLMECLPPSRNAA